MELWFYNLRVLIHILWWIQKILIIFYELTSFSLGTWILLFPFINYFIKVDHLICIKFSIHNSSHDLGWIMRGGFASCLLKLEFDHKFLISIKIFNFKHFLIAAIHHQHWLVHSTLIIINIILSGIIIGLRYLKGLCSNTFYIILIELDLWNLQGIAIIIIDTPVILWWALFYILTNIITYALIFVVKA